MYTKERSTTRAVDKACHVICRFAHSESTFLLLFPGYETFSVGICPGRLDTCFSDTCYDARDTSMCQHVSQPSYSSSKHPSTFYAMLSSTFKYAAAAVLLAQLPAALCEAPNGHNHTGHADHPCHCEAEEYKFEINCTQKPLIQVCTPELFRHELCRDGTLVTYHTRCYQSCAWSFGPSDRLLHKKLDFAQPDLKPVSCPF